MYGCAAGKRETPKPRTIGCRDGPWWSVTRRHVRNLLAQVDCLRRAKANPTPDSFCPCRGRTRDLACRMARRVESSAHRGSEHRRSKRGRGEGSAANRCVLVNTSCTGNAPSESLEKKIANEKADFLIALLAFAGIARAQTWPSRQIRLIVPFAPGGSTDVAARIMAEGMRPLPGQPVIIENVGGAGGSVGRVARAAPDG
jgi:Tripartite tricarboxylate transporter family receptor